MGAGAAERAVVHAARRAAAADRRGGAGASPVAAMRRRIPAGHPEGYLEAFAQLYRDLAEQITAHRQGRAARSGVACWCRGSRRACAGCASSPPRWRRARMGRRGRRCRADELELRKNSAPPMAPGTTDRFILFARDDREGANRRGGDSRRAVPRASTIRIETSTYVICEICGSTFLSAQEHHAGRAAHRRVLADEIQAPCVRLTRNDVIGVAALVAGEQHVAVGGKVKLRG